MKPSILFIVPTEYKELKKKGVVGERIQNFIAVDYKVRIENTQMGLRIK